MTLNTKRSLDWKIKSYPTKRPFTIARGTKSSADQIIVTLRQGDHQGRGACVPYPRNNESLESVIAQIEAVRTRVENELTLSQIQTCMPAGAARNAIDCALWDLHTAQQAKPVWALAGITKPQPKITATTLSIDTPDRVGEQAQTLSHAPLLKLKLAGDGLDLERVRAVIMNAPTAKLILDANESLTREKLDALYDNIDPQALALIEQPVPSGEDATLDGFRAKHILCADESYHLAKDGERLSPFYGAVNIKLDKTGGFSEAINAVKIAKENHLTIMLGCMLGSSLAMAPAFMLASFADYLDLDGPILLAQDDENGFEFEGSLMKPATLWGAG